LLEQTEETAAIQELQTRTGDIIAASLERLDGRLLQAVEI
jgi:Ser/Thr protein kinase RdoA (MazF antagonist)